MSPSRSPTLPPLSGHDLFRFSPALSDPDALPASNYLVIQTPGDNLASVGAAQPNPGEQLPPQPQAAAGGAQPPPFGPAGSGGKGASVVSEFGRSGSTARSYSRKD